MGVEAEIGKLKDAVVVMSAMLLRHEDARKQHGEEIDGIRGVLRELTAGHVTTQRQLGDLTGVVASLAGTVGTLTGTVAKLTEAVDEISKKLAENTVQLAGITGKLDSLIDVVDSLVKRERPPGA